MVIIPKELSRNFMLIHKPETTITNGEIIISARVDFSKPVPDVPDYLWFSFPEEYQSFVAHDCGQAFLLGMLAPAMYYKEDIEIRSPISPILAYNLEELQAIYHKGFGLSKVKIQYHKLEPFLPEQKPWAVVTAFSGGVDSMYTLYSHLPENQPIKEAQITHGLLVQGFNDFDIALEDNEYFERVYKRYKNMFSELGVGLLTAKTNAYQFSKFRIKWEIGNVPSMAAIAHLLGNLIRRFYRGGDGEYLTYGVTDVWAMGAPYLSNESLDFVSYSYKADRDEKLKVLAYWPPALENLRVCLNWDKSKVDLNCCNCVKCTQTMALLESIGEYEKFNVFKQPYPWHTILKFWWTVYGGALSLKMIRKNAKANKKYGMLFWTYLLHYPRMFKTWLYKQINTRLSDENKIRLRQMIFRPRKY